MDSIFIYFLFMLLAFESVGQDVVTGQMISATETKEPLWRSLCQHDAWNEKFKRSTWEMAVPGATWPSKFKNWCKWQWNGWKQIATSTLNLCWFWISRGDFVVCNHVAEVALRGITEGFGLKRSSGSWTWTKPETGETGETGNVFPSTNDLSAFRVTNDYRFTMDRHT